MNEDILTANLGLTEKEAKVYLAVLELGDSTIQPIARRSGVKRTSIYYFIDRLVELGLIDQAKIRGRMHYKAKPPEQMVSLQEQRLKEIKNSLPQFESLYNVSTKKPKISYFEGPEQMRQIMYEEWKCKQVWFMWSTVDVIDMIGGPKFLEELVQGDVERGVQLKVIRFREKTVPYKGYRQGESPGIEVRFAPEGLDFPMAIGIFDTGKVGFLTSHKEGFGILIESDELVHAMRMLFDLFWEQSAPAQEGEG